MDSATLAASIALMKKIPKGDPGDPTELIDDTAGEGDTDKVWSADKSHSLLTQIRNRWVTPESYGAKGDGSTDDTSAIQEALNSGYDVFFQRKTYVTSGVQITSPIHVYFDDTTLKANTNYQDYIINITTPVHLEGRININGNSKALCGIKMLNSYGSIVNRINVQDCLAWGVWIDYSGHATFDYISASGCGTVMGLTVSYESDTSVNIDSTLSAKNDTLLKTAYAVNMYMHDNSDYPLNSNGGKLIRRMNSYDLENGEFVCGDIAANRIPNDYINKSCYVCFGGAVYVGSACNGQINFGIIDTRLGSTGITFAATYGHYIGNFYSQGDRIPIAVTHYSLGNMIASMTIEGPKSGYVMVSCFYDYSVIVAKSTGYDNNYTGKEIVTLTSMGQASENPILLKSLRRTLPQFYALGETYVLDEQKTDNLIFSNTNSFTIDLRDKTPYGSNSRNPWGVKTVYFLPSSSQNNDITITLNNDLITEGYTIENGANGTLTFARPSDVAWFKVQIALIGTVFTCLIEELKQVSPIISGSNPVIVGMPNHRYSCGEISTLTITAPASGCIDVLFKSGSTPTVLTVSSAKTGVNAIKWANGFDPSNLDADTTYELSILDGELGVACSWT